MATLGWRNWHMLESRTGSEWMDRPLQRYINLLSTWAGGCSLMNPICGRMHCEKETRLGQWRVCMHQGAGIDLMPRVSTMYLEMRALYFWTSMPSCK
jgi:hypothetical protein